MIAIVDPLAFRIQHIPAGQSLDDLGPAHLQEVPWHVHARQERLGAVAVKLELLVEVLGS